MAGAGPERSPDARGADDAGLYPAFVARLREAGLDPDVEQLRDALWLARWARHPDAPPEDEEVRGSAPPVRLPPERVDGPPAAPGPAAVGPAPEAPRDEPLPRADPGDADRITLYPVPRPGARPRTGRGAARAGRTAALTFGVPAAPALPAPSNSSEP